MLPSLRFRYTMLPKDDDFAEPRADIDDEDGSTVDGRHTSHDEQVIVKKASWLRLDRYVYPNSGAPLF